MAENKKTTKKKESFLEKAEHVVEHAVKEIEKDAEEMVEKVEKGAKKLEKEVEEFIEGKEKKVKKTDKDKSAGDDRKAKLAKLLEKAKKLEGKVEGTKDIDLKKKVRSEEDEKKDTLVPIEDYLKSSIHLGTRVITPDMRKYVYRRRADGLAVFNTALLDDKLKEGAEYLAKFSPEEIILICKREAGWKAVNKFAEVTGVRVFTKKYPSGILTNTNLENFTEANLIFICDSWLDKNALQDANRIGVDVLSVCDTNNFTAGISQIIPGNNKSAKSLGIIFYLLTKLYVEKRKLHVDVPPIQDFIDGWDNLVPPK
ncbi:MAG: 30S ribosomal protein S2 [Nanoarchaeota archaeon]